MFFRLQGIVPAREGAVRVDVRVGTPVPVARPSCAGRALFQFVLALEQ